MVFYMEKLRLDCMTSKTCSRRDKDLSIRVTEEEKAPITAKIEELRKTVANGTTEQIKQGTEELQKAFYAISEKLYKQAQESGAAGADMGGTNPDGTVNADFTDNDNK